MSARLLIFSSLALLLFYLTYSFSANTQAKTISEVFESLLTDSYFIWILFVSGILTVAYLICELVVYFFDSNKYYAQRISVSEYEKQRQTYTQVKINELVQSEAYQKFLSQRTK